MFKNLAGVFYQVFKKYKRDGQVLYTLIIKQELWGWKAKNFFFNVFSFFGDNRRDSLLRWQDQSWLFAYWPARNLNLSLAIHLAALQPKVKQRKYPWNEAKARHKSGQLRKLSLVFWLFFLKTLQKIKTQPRIDPDLTRLSVQLNLSKQLGSWGIVNSLYIWKWTKTNL